MTQNWNLPTSTNEVLSTVLVTNIPDALRSLRSFFSGTVEPTSTVAHMYWADTSGAGVLKQRNAADSAWIVLGPLGVPWAFQVSRTEFGSVSVTTTKYLLIMPRKGNVTKLQLVCDTTSSSSSGNEWTFQIVNVTATLDLFSAAPGTFTSVGGVGGGADFAPNVPIVLTPDQNALIDAGDVLELVVTEVGAATSLLRLWAQLEYDGAGE
jgi:hypothetical protein